MSPDLHRNSTTDKGDTYVSSHAKAASAGSTSGFGIRRGLFGLVCLCVLGLAAFAGSGAPSAGATEACPNEQFRVEQHATFLPDCRAYEQVSSPNKNGADILVDTSHVQAAADGSAASFASLSAFGDSEGNPLTSEYLAIRRFAGWSTQGLTPPTVPLFFGEPARYSYRGTLSPDLSEGLIVSKSPLATPDDPHPNVAQAINLYLRDDVRKFGRGSYQLLSDATTAQTPINSGFAFPVVAGVSTDFSHVIFESRRNLTDDAVGANGGAGLPSGPQEPKLYEWINGTETLAGQVPPLGQTECGAGGPACEASLSQAGRRALNSQYTDRTISADGSRVIFTAPPFGDSGQGGKLYLRDDHGTASRSDDTTTQVNISERTDCSGDPTCGGDGIPDPEPDPAGEQSARFESASADGGKVFFTTTEQLTDDDHNSQRDLYRYDLGAPLGARLTRLSVDHEAADGEAQVNGVIGTSEDGTYVYFIADGQLVEGLSLVSGPRIYVWHNGTATHIGRISEEDLSQILSFNSGWSPGKWSRLAPDGTHLLFISQGEGELTGYNHGTTCTNHNQTSTNCFEIYLYDATANGGAGELRCASCNPSGAKATADATYIARVAEGASNTTPYLSHPLSDNGRYVFFTSAERLMAADTNGVDDAYEYDSLTDKLHLLSSGTDPNPSFFMDASSDGKDAFFITRQRLLAGDTDQQQDLYDARVQGGFPEPAPVPAVCEADACQGSGSGSPPLAPAPQSAVLSGAGNAKPGKRCPKGRHRVRRAGRSRCVKPHARKHHRRANRNLGGQK